KERERFGVTDHLRIIRKRFHLSIRAGDGEFAGIRDRETCRFAIYFTRAPRDLQGTGGHLPMTMAGTLLQCGREFSEKGSEVCAELLHSPEAEPCKMSSIEIQAVRTRSGRILGPHKAILSAKFDARTVLTNTRWEFVSLWLKREK